MMHHKGGGSWDELKPGDTCVVKDKLLMVQKPKQDGYSCCACECNNTPYCGPAPYCNVGSIQYYKFVSPDSDLYLLLKLKGELNGFSTT